MMEERQMSGKEKGLSGMLFDFARLYNEKLLRPYEDSYRATFTPMQFFALSLLKAYGEMTMTALCEKSGIRKQHATKLVEQLVQLGYAERRSDESDRRVVRVALTPAAWEYFDRHLEEMRTAIDGRLELLTEEEVALFRASISTVNSFLERMPGGSLSKRSAQ